MPEGAAFSLFDILHLFPGWGIVLQVVALVHLVKRRSEFYWIFIILMGGFVGAIAYILVEMLPDARLLPQIHAGFGRRKRIEEVQRLIHDNPSAANYEELGQLYFDEKKYAEAREAFNHSLASRTDSPHPFYYRAQCSLALGDYTAALADLEYVVHGEPRLDSNRAMALLAHCYAKTGNAAQADVFFAEATRISPSLETMYNYACFLLSQGRREDARQWGRQMLDKRKSLPRYMHRIERPWFQKAEALLKNRMPG